MVDPNRRTEDIEFLKECEREFANRFTEDDAEFMKYCSNELPEPPIIENFGFNGGGRYNNSDNNNRGGRRGGRYQNHNHYRYRSKPYDRKDYESKSFCGESQHKNHRERLPIPKDYGNFVAASKE